MISELEGRIEDILALSDGTFVHPRSIWQIFKQDPEILQYQLIQHEQSRFELAFTTATEEAFDRACRRALPNLRRLLGSDSVIEVHRRADLGCIPGIKFRAVISRVKRELL
jgi:phenylacetate-coenzyme A ligase PaaK-like adenylate-forming protein